MHANNETGAVNDVLAIQDIARKHNVAFYSDAAQTFGKHLPVSLDAFCVSFHKAHGVPGVGALLIDKQLLSDNQLPAMIYGTQNKGMRGGTENIPGLYACWVAFDTLRVDLPSRIQHMARCKDRLICALGNLNGWPPMSYSVYLQKKPEVAIVFFFTYDRAIEYLCNTLLISFVRQQAPFVCNVNIKKELCERGYIVSVGSACNTSSKKASHVLEAMNADAAIKRGTLRISLCFETTKKQIDGFIVALMEVMRS